MTSADDFYDARDAQPCAARLESLLDHTAAVLALGGERSRRFDLAALGALPILRKAALPGLQAGAPPFGDLVKQPAALFPRLFLSPGPICEPQLSVPDGSNAARALHAAGFRTGQIVLNTFNYHLTPGGFLMDEAARALGYMPMAIYGRIILPQALRRMIPGWMNLYALLMIATSLATVTGIQDVVTTLNTLLSMENERVIVYFYITTLFLFFAYCYPIALLARRMEQSVKGDAL